VTEYHVVLTFSAELNAATVVPGNFVLVGPDDTNAPPDADSERDSIGFTTSYVGRLTDSAPRVTLRPSIVLSESATFRVDVRTGVTDTEGTPVAGGTSYMGDPGHHASDRRRGGL